MTFNKIFLVCIIFLLVSCETAQVSSSSSPTAVSRTSAFVPPFADLKSWTEQVLEWDESLLSSAIENKSLIDNLDKQKITLTEFDRVINLFTETAIQSSMKLKNNWLNNIIFNDNFFTTDRFENSKQVFFGQKIIIPSDSNIIVMGDIHGSVHSLLRNLWRLVSYGYLDKDFKIIKNNTYVIFTGDFVDRGRYSVEVLYTLLRLKLANFENIYLLRGNHENENISKTYGLKDELILKYGDTEGLRVFNNISDFYRFLPVVVFAQIEGKNPGFLHFSHGGFSYDLANKKLLHSPANFLNDKKARFELMTPVQALGYMWSDFYQGKISLPNQRGFATSDYGVAELGKLAVLQYQVAIKQSTGLLLKAIFRGHQDAAFGLKMLFAKQPSSAELQALATKNPSYPRGPYYWKDVVRDPQKIKEASSLGITMANFEPIFTFTTAAEGRGLAFDSFGIIKTSDYKLQIHDINLKRKFERSYVTIKTPKNSDDDGVSISWSETGPGHLVW